MIERVILVCLAASLGVVGCGSSDGDGAGGDAGSGATGGGAGVGGGGGEGGEGGMGGGGGAGGEPVPEFTSLMDRIDAGLVYQLESCHCQDPAEAISESACLALIHFTGLPVSDRQNECVDQVILGEKDRTLENRFVCLIEADLVAADCLAEVIECSESAIADCLAARMKAQLEVCLPPHEPVREMVLDCQMTTVVEARVEDGVDAFLDSRSAQCDCITDCTSADPDQEVVDCMEDTLRAAAEELGAARFNELTCIERFWRRKAVCFGNEITCDGAFTACGDIPAPMPPCAISGTILLDIDKDSCPNL